MPAEGQTLSVSATISNAGGSKTGNSDSAKLDTTAPTITSLTVSNDGTQISGQTEPGAKVEVTLPTGEKLSTTADDRGQFTLTPKTPVEANKPISAVATDAAGNPSVPKEASRVIDAPGTAPTVSIVLDASDDGIINKAEKGSATSTCLLYTSPSPRDRG